MKKMIFKSAALLAAFLGLSESADAQVDAPVSSQIKVSSAAQTQLQNKVLNTNPNAYFMKEGPIFAKSGAIINQAQIQDPYSKGFVKAGAIGRPNINVLRPRDK